MTTTSRPDCVIVDCARHGQHLPDCEDTKACPGCMPRQAADDLLVCGYHHQRTFELLQQLPDLDVAMRMVLKAYRSPQAPKPETSGASFDAPDAISSNVFEMRQTLHMTLANNVSSVAVERHFHYPKNNIPAFVAFLVTSLDWIDNHPRLAPTWFPMVKMLVDGARQAAYPARSAGNYLGPCPMTIAQDGIAVVCGAPIRFDRLRYEDDDTYQPKCPRCKTGGTLAWWAERIVGRIDAAPDQLTAGPLAMWLNWGLRRSDITASMVRGWKRDGYIVEAAKNDAGQPLFDRSEAEAFARRKWHLPALEESA